MEIVRGPASARAVFIDHGMGVVIGETAEIGDRCLLFQGVTLGGTSKEHGKRHPTLGENVVVEQPAARCWGRSPWGLTPASALAEWCCAMWPPTAQW
jgi:hypothetical protein